jgi:predicted ATP-grasp superfamily ATP-dependent carboligase
MSIATMTAPASALRILLSEGASTSAREAITILGLKGHHLEVADPDLHCLGKFSRFVRRFHRCPPLGADPEGYRDFLIDLLLKERFDVLIPIHEQGCLLSKVRKRLVPLIAIALPVFESYAQALSGIGFSRLLSDFGMPQPRTRVLSSLEELRAAADFPFVLKADIGTASRGVWMIHSSADVSSAIDDIERTDVFGSGLLAQEYVEGTVERAQAVFCRGHLVAMHASRQVLRGAGGGDAVKESVHRPAVRFDLARLGARLKWHGALSVDYLCREADGVPLYIDCNPRLVEPMNGFLAGADLMDVLVRVSMGEEVPEQSPGRAGVRSHLAIQVFLGLALRGGTRRDIVRECWRLGVLKGVYQNSQEELTPVHVDWMSAIPLLASIAALTASPRQAHRLATGGWGDQLLTAETVRTIKNWPTPE